MVKRKRRDSDVPPRPRTLLRKPPSVQRPRPRSTLKPHGDDRQSESYEYSTKRKKCAPIYIKPSYESTSATDAPLLRDESDIRPGMSSQQGAMKLVSGGWVPVTKADFQSPPDCIDEERKAHAVSPTDRTTSYTWPHTSEEKGKATSSDLRLSDAELVRRAGSEARARRVLSRARFNLVLETKEWAPAARAEVEKVLDVDELWEISCRRDGSHSMDWDFS